MFVNIIWDPKLKQCILNSDYLENIREAFSVKDANAFVKKQYNKHLPSRKYVITPTGRFDIGLVAEILNYVKSLRIPCKFHICPRVLINFSPSYNFVNTHLSALKLDLRAYQTESVRKCLKHGRGVLKLATGAGKTAAMASLISTIHENTTNHFTIIIVPSVQLVEQTYKDLLSYGFTSDNISRVSGNHELEIGKSIIIAGSQYLLVSKNIPDILFNADLLVVDEVHSLRRDNMLNKVIKKFDTHHKFGLTGTLPDNKLDEWNIIGKIGPIIYEKESHLLQREGYLSVCEARILRLHYKKEPTYSIPSLSDPLVAFNEEKSFIMVNDWRNNIISKLAKSTPNNTLIVVDNIKHGKSLAAQIKKKNISKKVFFVFGEMAVHDRETIRDLMEKQDNIICIAITKIFATGINIKNLHYIILAVSGKAKVRLLQSIGRLLRLHENKKKVYIFDISDNLKYGKEHEEKRIKIYENEKIKYQITEYYEK